MPRILVVTPGTQVVFRNKESPCRGFTVTGSKPLAGNQVSFNIAPGSEEKTILNGPDICSVTCPVRPYAKGYIHVVDTPYFAVTDSKGSFTIRGVPAGDYQVTVWHEAVGKLTKDSGPVEISIGKKNEYALQFRVIRAHGPSSSGYNTAKAGVIRLTTTLKWMGAKEDIRVNCLVPHWIGTDHIKAAVAGMTPEQRRDSAVPDVLIAPEEVAEAVLRLATDKSLAGRVMVWFGGQPPRMIPFGDPGYTRLDDI